MRGPSVPGSVHIGTSGFLYEHWRGRFYPPSARGSELEYYAQRFDTVELNVTFYRMPTSRTFRSWASRVPVDFRFAVKASRYLTHIRRLREPGDPVAYLVDRIGELGPHLGPVLLQLPPDLEADPDRLAATLDAFPSAMRVAVEPRHASWFTDDVRSLLASRQAALCVADRRGPVTPLWDTATWRYLRFHGGRARPPSCYSDGAIERWAAFIRDPPGDGETFAFFNNDAWGCALRDAATLGQRLVAMGVAVGEVPDVRSDVVGWSPGDGRRSTPSS